jgi:hypothetical protein
VQTGELKCRSYGIRLFVVMDVQPVWW